MSRYIEEINAYRLWCFTKGVSFDDFKKQLLDAGYVILSWETEGCIDYDGSRPAK